jgi:methanogenic corrinoid protein MtbC1
VHGARLSGRTLAQVYERILVPSMAEVGRMWHMQEASIADEHFVTSATQAMMAQLRMDVPMGDSQPWCVLATSVGGDHHDMGVRMLSDLFEVAGWKVECLGANTPADEIVAMLDAAQTGRPINVLALGIGSSLSLRPLADTIAAVRASPAARDVRIIVGGQPFQVVPDLWKDVGADACAPTFSEAVEASERMMRLTAA